MRPFRRAGFAAAMVVVAVLALSGCSILTYTEKARKESIRNAAGVISDTIECFSELQLTPGEDLDALAKDNGFCGDWLALGATDEELAVWTWTLGNDTALIRIDESAGHPVVTMLSVGSATARGFAEQKTHTVIVCWQAVLDPSGGKPEATDFECPDAWLGSWSIPEVMTIEELTEAAGDLGVELVT